MAEASNFNVGGNNIIIKDSVAREQISELNTKTNELSSNLISLQTNTKIDISDRAKFGALTTISGRYGYEWLGLKAGKYNLTFTADGKMAHVGYCINGVSTMVKGDIADTTENIDITLPSDGDIVIWYYPGVTTNGISNLKLLSQYIGEQVNKLNDSLADYGLDENASEMEQGLFVFATGEPLDSTVWIRSKEYRPIKKNDRLTIKFDANKITSFCIFLWNGSTFVKAYDLSPSDYVIKAGEVQFTPVIDCTQYKLECTMSSGITPQTAGHIGVYVNNEIDQLKNDLIWQDDKWSVLQNCTIDDDYSMLCGDMFFVCITFTTTKEISNWSFSPIWINKSLISKPNVGYPILIQGNSSAKAFVKQYSTGVSLVVDNLPIGTYTICGAFPIK